MADKLPFFAAESGTWRTTSPDPHIDLSGTALTLGTYPAQTFKAAADDATLDFATTNTCTITAWKDATNWKRYEGAVWTDAATDTLDLSAATLMGAAGSIANGDAVSVVAGLPVITAASLGAVNTANAPNAGEFARFTDADTIEGRTYAETRADLDLEVGVDLARWLTRVTAALTTGNLTATVNAHHVLTISGMTAARSFVIPAGTAEGDLISWECITAAPATAGYEMVLIGDTDVTLMLAGTDREATADGAFRYLIAGETGTLRWDATASKWRLIVDGRIACVCSLGLSTSADGEPETTTFYAPTDYGGAWTSISDNASMGVTASGTINIRRGGKQIAQVKGFNKDAVSAAGISYATALLNAASATVIIASSVSAGTYTVTTGVVAPVTLAAGSIVKFHYYLGGGTAGVGCFGLSGGIYSNFSIIEVF
jgi:hypothetical protein